MKRNEPSGSILKKLPSPSESLLPEHCLFVPYIRLWMRNCPTKLITEELGHGMQTTMEAEKGIGCPQNNSHQTTYNNHERK